MQWGTWAEVLEPKDLREWVREEYDGLRRQIGTLKRGEHSKYLPMAFTEQGVAMLSSVLKSKQAIEVNVLIMRAFVQLRQMISSHRDLLRKVEEMERKYDAQFKVVFDAIRQLMAPSQHAKKKIGFQVKEKLSPYMIGVRRTENGLPGRYCSH